MEHRSLQYRQVSPNTINTNINIRNRAHIIQLSNRLRKYENWGVSSNALTNDGTNGNDRFDVIDL